MESDSVRAEISIEVRLSISKSPQTAKAGPILRRGSVVVLMFDRELLHSKLLIIHLIESYFVSLFSSTLIESNPFAK